jgi:hypothetical protein
MNASARLECAQEFSMMSRLFLFALPILFQFGIPDANAVLRTDFKSNRYSIELVENLDKRVSYVFCDLKVIPKKCEYLGNSEGYTLEERTKVVSSFLTDARWKFYGKGAALAVIGVITGGTALILGGAAGVGTASLIWIGTTTTLAAPAAVLTVEALADKLSKRSALNFLQKEDLMESKGFLTKAKIIITDEKAVEFARAINEILTETKI